VCGIYGFNFEDKKLRKKMEKKLAHRGPEDSGYLEDSFITLGHTRLKIIDLSRKGRQPMSNEDGTVWLSFNGEIYNYLSLRQELEKNGHSFESKTDVEVLVHGYEEEGIDFIERLNGMFAFALYDSEKKKLFLVRDRLGIKPLYFYFKDGFLLFASEIKAILEFEFEKKVNRRVLEAYISLRYNPLADTMVSGVQKLLPGHFLEFDGSDITMKKYWDINPTKKIKDKKLLIRWVKELLEGSVKKRLMSDVPLGAFLSGGIDSSVVVGLMSKNSNDEVKTFSIGFEGSPFDESSYAREVAEYFGTDHHEFFIDENYYKLLKDVVYHFDEPLADPAALPTYFLSREAKKHVTVVLTGEGADELFGGYKQVQIIKLANPILKSPKFIRKFFGRGVKKTPLPLLQSFFPYTKLLGEKGFARVSKFLSSDDLAQGYFSIISIFDEKEKKELLNITREKFNGASFFKKEFGESPGMEKIMINELKMPLPENLLMKVDKMSMAHSLEARVPYLDHRLVEFSLKIPIEYKFRGLQTKYLLREAFKDLLPKKIVKRQKQRFFVPIHEWLVSKMVDEVEEYLESGIKAGYFSRKYIEKIRRNYSRSPLYYARQLWCLICFELWREIFNIP